MAESETQKFGFIDIVLKDRKADLSSRSLLSCKKTAPAAQAHFSTVSSSSERIWLSSYQPTLSVCQSKEARKASAILRYFGKWSEAFVHPSRVRDWSGFGNDETSFRPDGCLQDFSRIGLDCELPEKFQISRVHPPFTA